MAGLQTEFPFTLPKGYVDGDGSLHRHGSMRLATARDEIEPLRDPRVAGPDDPYLTILVISRVINELGSLRHVGAQEVESLFAADLAFLQDLYGIINFGDPADVEVLQRAVVPPEEPSPQPVDELVASGVSPAAAATGSSDSGWGSRARGLIEEVSTPNGH
jgi:hypothetical protein